MISLVMPETQQQFLDFCDNSAMGTKTASPVFAYGADSVILNVWLQKNDAGEYTAAMCRFGCNVCLFAAQNANFDELKEFLCFLGTSVLCTKACADELGLRITNLGAIAACKSPEELWNNIHYTANPNLREVYNLLSESGTFKVPEFDDWYVDTSHRMRHSFMQMNGALFKNELCAVSITVAQTANAAVIGGVTSKQAYRGKGFASGVVTRLAEQIISEGKQVFLFCEFDKLDFYKRCGFEQIDTFACVLPNTASKERG